MFREMRMRFWLKQVEVELKEPELSQLEPAVGLESTTADYEPKTTNNRRDLICGLVSPVPF